MFFYTAIEGGGGSGGLDFNEARNRSFLCSHSGEREAQPGLVKRLWVSGY